MSQRASTPLLDSDSHVWVNSWRIFTEASCEQHGNASMRQPPSGLPAALPASIKCAKVFACARCNEIPSCVPWTQRGRGGPSPPRMFPSLCWWSPQRSPGRTPIMLLSTLFTFLLSEKRAFCSGGCKGSRSHMHVTIETWHAFHALTRTRAHTRVHTHTQKHTSAFISLRKANTLKNGAD